ncbi:MAG TPA: GTP cyclohydrolase II, partial [Candidatus Baltobacteraceae bacterium]|nr:GTP cyclohydrolase II [Candidatus Baltobacteraceae bacterium]
AESGGVLVRAGQTEAAVDLARIAGLYPAGVICEIMAEDGTMERLDGLIEFAKRHNLKLITVKDLIAYRWRTEKLLNRIAEFKLPTEDGTWNGYAYENTIDGNTHVALVMGEIGDGRDLLVRVHSECLTGDALHSLRCDCAAQRDGAMQIIASEGRGIFLYLRQEGRGIGLANKLRAYALQDKGADTVEANIALGLPVDKRDYGIGSQILADLGVKELRIITNNPRKIFGLEGYGMKIVGRVPLQTEPTQYNKRYIATKRSKLGHMFEGAAAAGGPLPHGDHP